LTLLIDAVSNLSKDLEISLTLVGDGPMRGIVEQKVKKYQLNDVVHLTGMVPYADVKAYYRSHDVFVFCSLRESFGFQLLEASAFGLPIITFNHFGAKDFLPEDSSIKVEATDNTNATLGITAAIVELYNNYNKRIEMGKNAYIFASKQNWDAKTEVLNKLYQEILQN
jgi:glycosyltransferase involved in cell wall biosynthesis